MVNAVVRPHTLGDCATAWPSSICLVTRDQLTHHHFVATKLICHWLTDDASCGDAGGSGGGGGSNDH